MALVESNVYGLWAAVQTAKGTPATTAAKRLIQVGGDIDINRDDGSENYSDATRFGDTADFVNTLVGSGSPSIQATPDELAWLLWAFHGSETFTAASAGVSPPKFVFEPGATIGKWLTFWKRVGMSQIHRAKFNDCRIGSVRIEGSTANKVVKIVPEIMSADPGEVFSADPSVAIPTVSPFIYTEGTGAFKVDGVVMRGHSQFAVVINDALSAYYGDDSVPQDFTPGNATITLEGVTMVLDTDGIATFNRLIYGTATPTAGAKPVRQLPVTGSYEVNLTRGTTDTRVSMKIEVPVVRWAPDVSIPPNPDGGPVELALGGRYKNNAAGGAPPTAPKKIRITVETGAGDSAAHT